MATIEIPDEIYEQFLQLLNLAQCRFTEEEVRKFSEPELAALKLVEGLLGDNRIRRYATKFEKRCSDAEFL